MTATDQARRLAELRHAFDTSFALPPAPPPDDRVDLLAVTVDGHRVAVPLTAMAGLVADRPVTPLPAAPPALLGVARLRGHLVPVYALAAVLDHGTVGAPSPGSATPRWLIVAAGSPTFAVAVDRVDGHLRVATDAIARPADAQGHGAGGTGGTGDGSGRAAGSVVSTDHGPRPVIDMSAVRAIVTTLATACPGRTDRES